MPDPMKRIIALCAVLAWFLLFGFSYSEVLEVINDKLESPDEPFQQALSLSAEKQIFIWDKSSEMPKFSELITVGVVNGVQTSISLNDSVNHQHPGAPSKSRLFKFLSTYRL